MTELKFTPDARIAEPILLELFHGARDKKELDTIQSAIIHFKDKSLLDSLLTVLNF
ncbi:MAG: hypothetical protein KBF99_06245 [Leptospiraceae bacterium]|nr:hypothetical protein [Leptospiraceae bacterium]MBK9498214.1 hypothetical protein [Leptospiraceae bacterium]MBK9498612.1 hypothetical protein [Leptospiraceae bacterium]MBL0266446.1 hypothetical protein [Leptospiraceae bacterium]MBP9162762.1 hypothetical protein [Leptospiraceae bacterium]